VVDFLPIWTKGVVNKFNGVLLMSVRHVPQTDRQRVPHTARYISPMQTV